MKHTVQLLPLLTLGAIAWLSSCSADVEASGPGEPATAEVAAAEADKANEATLDTLTARALARWQLIENEDWVQAYTFLGEVSRRNQDLGSYMSGSKDHHYLVKSTPQFVAADEKYAYVQVLVEWTPTHPALLQADNVGEGSLTRDIDMIETWTWQGDDWYFLTAGRESEFRATHPSLFARDKPADQEQAAPKTEDR